MGCAYSAECAVDFTHSNSILMAKKDVKSNRCGGCKNICTYFYHMVKWEAIGNPQIVRSGRQGAE